jgi:Predicted transcriptional regulator containing an HTH domain and an uncharacterized domain shared with the mammalian protein Schlafen
MNRVETLEYSATALREMFLNALVHRKQRCLKDRRSLILPTCAILYLLKRVFVVVTLISRVAI